MDVFEVVLWILDYIFEMINFICLLKCFGHHVIKPLTSLVKINLPEQFKPALVNHVDLVIYLLVICDLSIDYAGVVDNTTVIYF